MQHHIGTAVGGRFDEILCRHIGATGDLGQPLDGQGGVLGRGVQTGPDGGGTQVHFQQQLLATLDGLDLFAQGHGEGMELLAQGHGDSILQLGTAHLQDALEFLGLGIEGCDQRFQGIQGGVGAVDHGDAETGGVGVIGGLALVDVVVRVDDVVTSLLQTHDFQGDVGQHFVGVHVDGGTGAALIDIDRELVEAFAGIQHQITGFDDLVSNFGTYGAELTVGQCGGLLGQHHATDKFGNVRNLLSADLEVLDGAQGMHTVIEIVGNFFGAQQVFFNADVLDVAHCNASEIR